MDAGIPDAEMSGIAKAKGCGYVRTMGCQNCQGNMTICEQQEFVIKVSIAIPMKIPPPTTPSIMSTQIPIIVGNVLDMS